MTISPPAAPIAAARTVARRDRRVPSRLTDPVGWSVFIALTTAGVWLRGGGWQLLAGGGDAMWLAVGQVAGLVAALGGLAGVILVARPTWIERRSGLDQMIRWHRSVGIATILGLVVHVAASTVGFAAGALSAAPAELWRLLRDEPFMVAALVATWLFVTVALTSWRRVKARMSYEAWYLLHLNGYLAVLLGFGHQVLLGQTFADDALARWFWIGLFAAAAFVVLWSRLGSLIQSLVRRRTYVAAAHQVARDTVAVTIGGPGVPGFRAVAGQFVSARFVTSDLWWQSHPFSLSAAPDGRHLRLTIKNLGDATSRLQTVRPGTRVLLQGPYGRMTLDAEPDRALILIGAGVGLAPMVSLLHGCEPWRRPIVLARGHERADIPHLAEIQRLTAGLGGRLFVITGSRSRWRGGNPFLAEHLRQQIPGIAQRAAFVCGPPALQSAAAAGLRRAGMPGQHIHSERFGW